MRTARGFSVENALTVKLLLAVRKGELIAARWDEFELDADTPVWHLPGERTKTGQPIGIPLPTMSVDWLRELHRLALDSAWVLPARKMQGHMLPCICESTIGVAMNHKLKGVEGIYNRHNDFAERKVALAGWGQLLVQHEQGESSKGIPIAASRRVA